MADATQVISSGHNSDLALGWYIIIGLWVILILSTIAVLVDSLLKYRKRRVAQHAEIVGVSREPLLMYTAVAGVIITVWIASMLPLSESYVYTMSIAAAFAAFAAIALIFTYLLRMVFPRVPADKVADYVAIHGDGAEVRPVDRHDVTVIDGPAELVADADPFDMELFADDNPKGA